MLYSSLSLSGFSRTHSGWPLLAPLPTSVEEKHVNRQHVKGSDMIKDKRVPLCLPYKRQVHIHNIKSILIEEKNKVKCGKNYQ